MNDRSKEVTTTGLVFTAALSIGIALCWMNRRKIFPARKFSLTWLRTKLLLGRKQIIVVNSREQCASAINKIISECREFRYVGFDCEWLPQRGKGSRQNPVALLQLATPKGTCALFRLCHIGFVPEEVKAVLRDPTLLKIGVAPMDDARLLFRDFGANVHGCLDLRLLHQSNKVAIPLENQSKSRKGRLNQSQRGSNIQTQPIESSASQSEEIIENVETSVSQSEDSITVKEATTQMYISHGGGPGLAKMSYQVLGVELDKNWRVRCSNWQADTLSEAQLEYAANDALVSALMFERLVELNTSSWWQPWKSSKSNVKWSQVWSQVSQYVDINPKCRSKETTVLKQSNKLLQVRSRPLKSLFRHISTRQKPLYDNCFLQAPDGEVLCTCDKKKAEWYMIKGLADIVPTDDDSLVIRLKFEPSGRAGESRKYYTLLKQNVCVVCGKEESYIKKNVVPHEYRKHFPNERKEHQSHDVLLLCLLCNQKANASEIYLRTRLADQCNAPLGTKEHARCFSDPKLGQVRSAARALLKSGDVLPPSRLQELRDKVTQHFGIPDEELSDGHVHLASNCTILVENDLYEPHGLKVVEYYQSKEYSEDGIFELEKIWRQHFIDFMQPKYLPELWSIEHKSVSNFDVNNI